MALTRAADIDLDPRSGHVRIDGQDVTEVIRTPRVNDAVSLVAAMGEVREVMVAHQRRFARENGRIVAEGRDIQTVVFPEAVLKVYLDASEDVRVDRRVDEMRRKDPDLDAAAVRRALADRDRMDRGRELAPLKAAPDAVLLDTSDLTPGKVLERLGAAGTFAGSAGRDGLNSREGVGFGTSAARAVGRVPAAVAKPPDAPLPDESFPPHARTRQGPHEGNPRRRAPERRIEDVFGSGAEHEASLTAAYDHTSGEFAANKVVKGKIVDIRNDEVVVDIGYKSEGVIPLVEFADATEFDVGDIDRGPPRERRRGRPAASSSRSARPTASAAGSGSSRRTRKATRSAGACCKKIKGGLLVDIGVPVFLPASQVDDPPPGRHRRVHRQGDRGADHQDRRAAA